MDNYLIIGGSSGIGQELADQLAQSGRQVFATFNKNEPAVKYPNIRFDHVNVLEESFLLDFLPDQLAGLVYCPGSINLKPFERIKPADFETDYKLQVIGAITLIQASITQIKEHRKMLQSFYFLRLPYKPAYLFIPRYQLLRVLLKG